MTTHHFVEKQVSYRSLTHVFLIWAVAEVWLAPEKVLFSTTHVSWQQRVNGLFFGFHGLYHHKKWKKWREKRETNTVNGLSKTVNGEKTVNSFFVHGLFEGGSRGAYPLNIFYRYLHWRWAMTACIARSVIIIDQCAKVRFMLKKNQTLQVFIEIVIYKSFQ